VPPEFPVTAGKKSPAETGDTSSQAQDGKDDVDAVSEVSVFPPRDSDFIYYSDVFRVNLNFTLFYNTFASPF
jgi:hypothetical protein